MKKEALTIALILVMAFLAGLAGCSEEPAPAPAAPAARENPVPASLSPEAQPDAAAQELETGPQIGKLAPDFSFRNSEGQSASLSGYRGKSVVLNFWATWCGPCRMEMPFIQALSQDTDKLNTGLVLLTVNGGEPPERVSKFMAENGFSFPVLLDEQMMVTRAYSVRGIPATFFIDTEGIIRDIQNGAFPSEAALEKKLDTLINVSPE